MTEALVETEPESEALKEFREAMSQVKLNVTSLGILRADYETLCQETVEEVLAKKLDDFTDNQKRVLENEKIRVERAIDQVANEYRNLSSQITTLALSEIDKVLIEFRKLGKAALAVMGGNFRKVLEK